MSTVIMSEETATDLVPMLIMISKTTRALYGLKLAELGFHNGQDELLMALSRKGMPVSVVAVQLSIRPSTVSKMTDRLVAKGLLERLVDERDARRTLIRITPKGTEACERLHVVRAELEAELSKTFTQGQHAAMSSSLKACEMHLSNRLKRMR